MYFYQAYGLNIRSDFFLPELPEGGDGSDLSIQYGKLNPSVLENAHIPRQGIEAWFGRTTDSAYLHWPGIATFCAQNGAILWVDPISQSIDKQVLNLYILSEALGLILHQKGIFLLHASAIEVSEQVIVFVGVPGAGKSTTAAAFSQRGYPVLSDDMVAITFDSTGNPLVLPGFPQIKIWQSSVQGLGYDKITLPTLFQGSTKHVIRQFDDFPRAALPLAHIFVLEVGETFKLTRMLSSNALISLTRFFPCPEKLLQGAELARHFHQCTQLVHHVPLWQLERPKSFSILSQLITWLEEEFLPNPYSEKSNPLTLYNSTVSKL